MPIFADALAEKGYTKINGSINDHIIFMRRLFPKIFEGKSFNPYLQDAVKNGWNAIKEIGTRNGFDINLHVGDTWANVPKGKANECYETYIEKVEEAFQDGMKSIFPIPVPTGVGSVYATLISEGKVVFERDSLASKLDDNTKTKIASIYDYGSTYGGHGPTRNLGAGVLHAHVGNGDGIGFKWIEAQNEYGTALYDDEGVAIHHLKIYAYGKKSDSARSGSSGYNWTER